MLFLASLNLQLNTNCGRLSEAEVQCELHLAHGIGRRSDLSRASHIYSVAGNTQIHMVECVEILPTKFNGLVLYNYEFFRERQIEDEQSGAAQGTLGNIAIAIGSLRRGICGGIEP